jgi:hypothetical protein
MHLKARPCKLGSSLNCRTEKHGDEDVPAIDIPIEGYLLSHEELNELFGPLTWESLFNTRLEAGKVPEILHPKFAPRAWTEKYEGTVKIELGVNQLPIELEAIKLAKLRILPLAGGLTALSLSVQVSEHVERFVAKLVERQATEVTVQIDVGDKIERQKGKQAELPMDHAGEGDEGGDGPDAASDDDADARADQVAAFGRGTEH